MSARICQACGTQMPQGAQFCPNCGKEAMVRVCQSCGIQVIEGARFCPNCGNEVTPSVCQACGTQVLEGARFCPNCGKEITLPIPSGKQYSYPGHSNKMSSLLHPSMSSLLHPSLKIRLVSGIAVAAIVLFFWLGLPIIKNTIPNIGNMTLTTSNTSTTSNISTTKTTANSPWPDVPLYPGARPAEAGLNYAASGLTAPVPGMEMDWHFFRISDNDLVAVIPFYKSRMPETSWQYITDTTDPASGAVMAIFSKGSEMLVAMTVNDPNIGGTILGLCRLNTQ